MLSSGTRTLKQIRARVLQTLERGLQFDLSIDQSERFLRRHVNGKAKLVVLYVDINGSTKMSLSLPAAKLASIIQVFSQEISLIVADYGGYVLKYVGDAVIALFPAEFDKGKACENATHCAREMLAIIKECINPVLKSHQLPEITIKIGLDYGDALVVLYGKNLAKAHIDLIGSNMSIAAKMTSIAQPNEIIIGESIYKILPSDGDLKKSFIYFHLDSTKWNYHTDEKNDKIYKLFLFRSVN